VTLPSSFRTPALRSAAPAAIAVVLLPVLFNGSNAAPAARVAPDPVVHAHAESWPPPGLRSGGGPVPFSVVLADHPAGAGMSGALRARIVLPGEPMVVPLDWGAAQPHAAWYQWLPAHGTAAPAPAERPIPRDGVLTAPEAPGTWTLAVGWDGGGRVLDTLTVLVRVPATAKRNGVLHGYRIGGYPAGSGRYAPPAGFIEVTRENRDLFVSENFQLRQFLTKDQFDVWPKFVLVDPLLLDKLELVITELRAEGIRADRMFVMSGYRTPQYNGQGLGQGRSSLSRHQYGDAADVWIENGDRPGYMADLNGDGRVDENDARVMLRALERVEARHPRLTGGAGVYRANAAHGPFLHVDVRGSRARW
jgi:hypothetical protein